MKSKILRLFFVSVLDGDEHIGNEYVVASSVDEARQIAASLYSPDCRFSVIARNHVLHDFLYDLLVKTYSDNGLSSMERGIVSALLSFNDAHVL